MANDDLFSGLPPPSAPPPSTPPPPPPAAAEAAPAPALKSALKRKDPPPSDSTNQAKAPALKSALKREKPSFAASPDLNEEASGKRLRFRTVVDQTDSQLTEAMTKIASHISNPKKFSKASKLTVQLIQSGSVNTQTSEGFFAILEGAMGDLMACNAPDVRREYHELFIAAQNVAEYFSKKQKNQLAIWTLHAVVANDLHTDDSFVFSKTVTKIKELILNLPPATPEEDKEEADSLASSASENQENIQNNAASSAPTVQNELESEPSADPFGLDDLFNEKSKKNEKMRSKDVAALNKKEEEEESKRFLKAQREALVKCLEIAAKRYKIPWTQTATDILAKHASDHVSRFTAKQRSAISSLWGSIKEQQIRRKQGRSVTGKLDVNGFEWLQEKYSREKISIRRAVGGSGGRNCEQWLG